MVELLQSFEMVKKQNFITPGLGANREDYTTPGIEYDRWRQKNRLRATKGIKCCGTIATAFIRLRSYLFMISEMNAWLTVERKTGPDWQRTTIQSREQLMLQLQPTLLLAKPRRIDASGQKYFSA